MRWIGKYFTNAPLYYAKIYDSFSIILMLNKELLLMKNIFGLISWIRQIELSARIKPSQPTFFEIMHFIAASSQPATNEPPWYVLLARNRVPMSGVPSVKGVRW